MMVYSFTASGKRVLLDPVPFKFGQTLPPPAAGPPCGLHCDGCGRDLGSTWLARPVQSRVVCSVCGYSYEVREDTLSEDED